MNIAIDIRVLGEQYKTGVGEYTYNLLNSLFILDKENQYFLFFNSSKKNKLPKFDFPNVKICSFSYPNKLLNLTLLLFKYPKLDKLIAKKFKQEIDLFFFPNINFFQTKCDYIVTCHDLSYKLFPRFFSFKMRLWHKLVQPKKIFNQAKKVIAVSKNTASDLQSLYDLSKDKIAVIYSGIDKSYQKLDFADEYLKLIKAKYNLPAKFLLYLGTIEPRKNLLTLIKAFSKFQQFNRDYRLVLVGKLGWKHKQILQKIKQNKNILYIDYIPEEDKKYFYNLAKLFIFPSYYEGFGFPPLEAMASGCPVVLANNSSLLEISNYEHNLFNAYDYNDLYLAIKKTLDCKPMSFADQKNFDWENTAKEVLQLFS